jgi:ABC-type spermidine/putrescine transport system permease subunit II
VRVVGFCVAGLFALLLMPCLVSPLLVSASVSVTGEEFLAFPPVGFSWRWHRAIWATRASLAIGHAIFALPVVVQPVLSAIRPRDRMLEAAARTLGASPLTAFRRVRLPLLLPGVVAGAVLSFMVSFDDVTLPIFRSGSSAGTLPKAMLDALALDSDPTVMSASTLVALVGLALFALGSLVSRWLSSRR